MALQEATQLFGRFKLKLIQLPALPPVFEQTPTAQQELLLGREVLEQGVLLALRKQDEGAMERSFAQLRTFYNDTRPGHGNYRWMPPALVLAASKSSASAVTGQLLAQLAITVREKAYERLSLGEAAKLWMLDSQAAVRTYAQEHGWAVTSDGYILFRDGAAAADGADGPAVSGRAPPSLELINNALVYAKELERIV
ncbi:hypothetical protein GPECTOR_24g231 [Gonium pectorale]|uniref:CSN8/PSMD8/EIF3K domain-containing protein n=1 Tax=Gonium pectorale TaxID=33097 RepID=A0A150GGH3_GONPE|nr:hypothetical protein GPECTOR_24g231 [Gonium pectorale]|eukprot:KXZ48941.1 hypothetical protein GPECTOR_24g231 [Gonium pectorale]